MPDRKLGVGIVGCGIIAGRYARDIAGYSNVELIGGADIDPERAAVFASDHGCKAYRSVDALLEDDAIELVVNLTIQSAHREIAARSLGAGKHVHSEKPLALAYKDARSLVDLASEKRLRLSCSPMTWMGEAQQTAWKLIRDGRLGTVRAVYAEANWGRPESRRSGYEPFYLVGPVVDLGVYPLTTVTTMFGPVRKVLAFGKVLSPDRTSRDGVSFRVETPEFVVAVAELGNGVVVRLTANWYVDGRGSKQRGLEFHGDAGSLCVSELTSSDARVEYARFGAAPEAVQLLRKPHKGTEFGLPVHELADAILHGRPHRASGEQAAHVVEVLDAIRESVRSRTVVEVGSDFPPPDPAEWAV